MRLFAQLVQEGLDRKHTSHSVSMIGVTWKEQTLTLTLPQPYDVTSRSVLFTWPDNNVSGHTHTSHTQIASPSVPLEREAVGDDQKIQ